MDPISKTQIHSQDKAHMPLIPKCGCRAPQPVKDPAPVVRMPQDAPPVRTKDPVRALPRRLKVAAGDVVEGTARATRGVAKTVGNGALTIVEGVTTVSVITTGGAVLAVEGIAAGTAVAAGVAVGLGVGAVELAGKGAQAVGKAAEKTGDAAVRLRRNADALLVNTTLKVADLARKGLEAIKKAFAAGVDAVSPGQ